MFARRVIDVRSEVWSAPLPYLDSPSISCSSRFWQSTLNWPGS